MDAGDSFWNETMGKCQDWWVRITNDPLPNHAIFYVVNLSDHSCELAFNNVGENNDKILLNSRANCFSTGSLKALRREIKKKDGYKWRTTLIDLTYELSKIMLENPPMPEIQLDFTYSSNIVFLPTVFVKSNVFLITNNDHKEPPYSVFSCLADFEVGKFLLNDSLDLPKDIRLRVLSYFFIFESTFDDGQEIKYELRYD